MPNLKNKTKFNSSSIPKNVGWLEKYGDGGLKSVTGPAPKLDAKTIAEGKRIASGYNNANKQNAQISQTRNWSQADQEHSDRVKARINNPASDVGILAANMASNLTRFRNLTPEEIARVTDNVGETVNLSSGIATDALTNELVGYGASKAIPFVSKSAKSAGKYLTEETALKNAYKLNPYAFKPNPESYYRMVGKEGIKDATESGIIRANQKIPLADNGEPFGDLITPEFEDAYFSKSRPFDGREYGKTPWYGKYEGPGMIEVKNKDYFKPLSKHIDYIGLPKSTIKTSDEAIKFYKEHWLQGYKEVPKELPGSSNKINTKKMWRIENPNIKFNPSKVANENAQQEHVGNWFSDDINYVSDYLRKNQKVPGSRLAEVNVPESELSKYHISNYPDMKDVEPRNWLIPDAFNRNYTDLSHLPISGGNLSKIKENQNYIKELVNKKIAEKEYGGWLEQYGDGGETDPPGGLKNNQWMGANLNKEGYITSETKGGNRISFTSDQKADDFFNKQIDSGKWGFDPKTGGTFLLKKPVKGLSKEDQFIGSETYSDLQTSEGFTNKSQKEQISKLPEFQKNIINAENEKRRKNHVRDNMKKAYQNPLMYAPGIIGAAPFAVAGLSEAGMASAPYIQEALSTQLPGMANVSGATVGNAITAGFAGHGAAHITPDAIEMYKNPSWSNAGSLLMDVAEVSPIIGPTSKVIGEGLNATLNTAKNAGKYLTEETALKNAYKLNPFANKNPLFSNLVKEGEVIKHPFRNQQVPIEKLSNEIDYFHLKADPENIPYSAAKNTDTWNQLNEDSRFFVKRTDNTPNAVIDNPISYGDDLSDPRKLPIPMNELYKYRSAENLTGKPNWLNGYSKFSKELPGSSNKFKSEIDWSKWNKEIPDNTQLMKEYNTIEQTSKANGTWMKNPDGSKFEGTPEQFVQQNSENFKKAFPEGFDKTYRGVSNFFNTNKLNEPLFTGDISNAKHYASANNPGFWNVNKNIIKEASKFTDPIPQSLEHLNMVREASKTGDWSKVRAIEYNDVLNSNAGGVHSFYSPKSKNSITIDAKSKEWTNIPYEGREMPTDFVAEDLFNKNLDYININNVRDPRIGDLKIINPNRINAKSARGNNGMFDMTNPNIYKAAIPIGLGVAALQNKQDNSQWLDKYK